MKGEIRYDRSMNVTSAQLTVNVKEISQLTLRNIRQKTDNIKENYRSAIRIMASKITHEGADYWEIERDAGSVGGV